jgi:hypothetical protein
VSIPAAAVWLSNSRQITYRRILDAAEAPSLFWAAYLRKMR